MVPKLMLFALFVVPMPAAAQWTYVESGTTAELRGLSVVDSHVAWTSGANGTVLRSVDAGQTWTSRPIADAAALDFRSIWALDSSTAFVASAGEAEKGLANIFATRDGGATWRRVFATSTKGVFLDAIAFWDAKYGIALSDPVQGKFYLVTTADGGRTWSHPSSESMPAVLAGEAAFAASGSALIVHGESHVWIGTGGGGRARVLHSADRGMTWSVADVPVYADGGAAGIFSLDARDARYLVAAGGDYTKPRLAATSIAFSRDSGHTWQAAMDPPPAYLSGVSFERGKSRRVAAVGLAGTFVFDGSTRWTQTDTIALNAIRIAHGVWIAVGPRGRIARMTGEAP